MKIIKMLKINLIIASIIISPYAVLKFINMVYNHNLNIEQIFQMIYLLYGIFLVVNIICLPIYMVKLFTVSKKIVNEQYIDSKESIYTRDLPQEYNSVIAGELLDFKSNIKDEYVAGVIELISEGYIIEDKETLIINKNKSTNTLLKNEKYILETLTTINEETYIKIRKVFLEKIREDMFDLGLYRNNNFLGKIILYFKKYDLSESFSTFLVWLTLIIVFFLFLFRFKLMFFISISTYITILIILRQNKLTEKGEKEKETISKLKLFFDRETNFKDKTKEERKIWGRYSAFAVALGTNEAIKEEIYKKILEKWKMTKE